MNRTTRRLSLTEVGHSFYERSQKGLRELEAAEAEVSHLQSAPRGTLRLNTPMSFGILHIAPVLSDFLTAYPDLSIDMNLDDRQVDLVAEGFDLAIRIAELPDSSLVARRLGPCHHTVCATPEYLQRNGVPRTPQELREHNVITFKYQESANKWYFLAPDGKPVSVPVTGSIQMNNSLALREALLSGIGITRTPTFVAGPDIISGRLQPVLTNYRSLEASVYVVYPQRRHLSPKVRAFIDFMSSRISDSPYWDHE